MKGIGNLYVTINDTLRGGRPWPFEMFVATTAAADRETCETTALLVTALLRQAADPTFVFEHLAQVQSADGGAFVEGRHLPSRAAAVAYVLRQHFARLGLIDTDGSLTAIPGDFASAPAEAAKFEGPKPAAMIVEICPKCGSRNSLVRSEGCFKCAACSYERCS